MQRFVGNFEAGSAREFLERFSWKVELREKSEGDSFVLKIMYIFINYFYLLSVSYGFILKFKRDRVNDRVTNDH